jgi:hypothetical protein
VKRSNPFSGARRPRANDEGADPPFNIGLEYDDGWFRPDRDILEHCRSEQEHVRGCWVVDKLTGKE